MIWGSDGFLWTTAAETTTKKVQCVQLLINDFLLYVKGEVDINPSFKIRATGYSQFFAARKNASMMRHGLKKKKKRRKHRHAERKSVLDIHPVLLCPVIIIMRSPISDQITKTVVSFAGLALRTGGHSAKIGEEEIWSYINTIFELHYLLYNNYIEAVGK
jgi:hypothetical protein